MYVFYILNARIYTVKRRRWVSCRFSAVDRQGSRSSRKIFRPCLIKGQGSGAGARSKSSRSKCARVRLPTMTPKPRGTIGSTIAPTIRGPRAKRRACDGSGRTRKGRRTCRRTTSETARRTALKFVKKCHLRFLERGYYRR